MQLAVALGTTPTIVSQYQNGRHDPGASTVRRVAAILGCTADELLTAPSPSSGSAVVLASLPPGVRALVASMQEPAKPAMVATRASAPDKAELDRIIAGVRELG